MAADGNDKMVRTIWNPILPTKYSRFSRPKNSHKLPMPSYPNGHQWSIDQSSLLMSLSVVDMSRTQKGKAAGRMG